eukprot:scaffold249306_cov73-Cyclotella_meneghiniana.AAC.5
MGPVVALAYGTTILDRKMVRMAWKNELLSLLICILIGVVIGACTGGTKLAETWPTNEMKSRCNLQNLLIGIPIGKRCAISQSTMVGVAISASLLPPAVNCGIVAISWYFIGDHSSGGMTYKQCSMLMFRLKEVLPIEKKIFWSDLGIARKIYQGKAVLARQAFYPVENDDEAEPGRTESLWAIVRNNLHIVNEIAPTETFDSDHTKESPV